MKGLKKTEGISANLKQQQYEIVMFQKKLTLEIIIMKNAEEEEKTNTQEVRRKHIPC